jgi:prepilin-type processing-associated H-X9-DG protein
LSGAFLFYVQDYSGYLPTFKLPDNSKAWYYTEPGRGFIAPYLQLKNTWVIGFVGFNGGKPQRSPLACPSVPYLGAAESDRRFSYGMNHNICVADSTFSGYLKLARVKLPSKGCLTSESITSLYCAYQVTNPDYKTDFRHSGGANILFLDFHVKHLKRLEVPDQAIDTRAWKSAFWNVRNWTYSDL